MSLSETLAALLRPWHRHREDDLPAWLEVFSEAFTLAEFILADRNLAKETALDAISRLSEERPKRRHRISNRHSHSKKVGNSRLRKPFLPDHLELDLHVYRCATVRERIKQQRGHASQDDYDVWFVKCVIAHAYFTRSPAFSLTVGISGALHTYHREFELPAIWLSLIDRIPSAKEPWLRNAEPFEFHWSKLIKALKERMPEELMADGQADFRRRPCIRTSISSCAGAWTMQIEKWVRW